MSCQTITSPDNSVTIKLFKGREAEAFTKDIARMRLVNFKEYPYLYDGTEEYERKYLETYFTCPQSAILLVFDGDEVVGFSNSIPLSYESEDMRKSFISHGLDVNEYIYSGECILNEKYRGRKLGKVMMEYHEARARELGTSYIALMTVERAQNHPLRHAGYVPTDKVLQKMGYEVIPNVTITGTWKSSETHNSETHELFFWRKDVR